MVPVYIMKEKISVETTNMADLGKMTEKKATFIFTIFKAEYHE